jgi:glycosyltransferase involved in cell wall biosynthesis
LIGALSGFHPLVLAMQGAWDVWPLDTWTTPIKKKIAGLVVTKADLIHTWGKHMKENCIKLGANPDKILMMPRGIDLDIFFPPKDIYPPKEIKIIVTRSLKTEYNHIIILQAVARLIEAEIPIKLIIVGDGYLKEPLIQLTHKLDIQDSVVFTGRIDNRDLPELLRDSNIYVSMPDTEGVSASLFEAMACGCFPIVTDHEANRSWINDGENGLLIEPGKDKELSEAILKVFQNPAMFLSAIKKNIMLIKDQADRRKNISIFVENYYQLLFLANSKSEKKTNAI